MLVLENAYEKIIRDGECAMKRRGATIVRGENVILVGTVNGRKIEEQDSTLLKAEFDRLAADDQKEWSSFEEKAKRRIGSGIPSVSGFDDTFY